MCCSKANLNKKVLSFDLNNVNVSEAQSKTVVGSEFQTAGAAQRYARLPNTVLMKGADSSGRDDERSVRVVGLLLIRRLR